MTKKTHKEIKTIIVAKYKRELNKLKQNYTLVTLSKVRLLEEIIHDIYNINICVNIKYSEGDIENKR